MKLEYYHYPIQINEWKHVPDENFMGRNESSLAYGVGLSKLDVFDRRVYFNVKIFHRYNNSTCGCVFSAETLSCFRITFNSSLLTVSFLFELVNSATFEYAKLFHNKTKKTNLSHHKIFKPDFNDLKENLQELINGWDADHQIFVKEKRRRLLKFRELPEIPIHKQYRKGNHVTEEQILSRKLFSGEPITKDERLKFEALFEYYRELETKLKILNYSVFDVDDLRNFRDYLLYAFNFTPLLTTQYTFQRLYRLVINESVTGKNERIRDKKYLKYPNLEIVKEKKVFNRGSTTRSTLFYLTEDIDTAITETKPLKNKLVTVGVWKPIKDRSFTSYPIVHNEKAIISNPKISDAYNAVKSIEAQYDPLFLKHIHTYMKLLCNEYSKPVSHHYEYLISAIFTETIFDVNDDNPDFNFECIIYPSVANKLKTRNIAVKPEVADEEFELEKVIEFQIDKFVADFQQQKKSDPEDISVAKVKDLHVTSQILQNGKIVWG